MMSQNQRAWTPPMRPVPVPRRGRRWLRTLVIGVLLFVATTLVMFLTGNPNLYPTVILIGNFLIPIVFVAFLYDHQHISALSLDTVATSFCVGGVGCAGSLDTRNTFVTRTIQSRSGPIPGQCLPGGVD